MIKKRGNRNREIKEGDKKEEGKEQRRSRKQETILDKAERKKLEDIEKTNEGRKYGDRRKRRRERERKEEGNRRIMIKVEIALPDELQRRERWKDDKEER